MSGAKALIKQASKREENSKKINFHESNSIIDRDSCEL